MVVGEQDSYVHDELGFVIDEDFEKISDVLLLLWLDGTYKLIEF